MEHVVETQIQIQEKQSNTGIRKKDTVFENVTIYSHKLY